MDLDFESVPVRLDVDGQIGTITIDRPEVRNAIDAPTADALALALNRVEADRDVAVIVLTGAGGIFSAGMDLKAYASSGELPINLERGLFGLVGRPPEKPLIAAVEGRCLGGGFELALACDLIVAADNTSFGLPEVLRGRVAAGGGLIRLPRRIPRNLAMEMAMTGCTLDSARARDLGLVARVVPAGMALAEALALATTVGAGAPLAVRASKRIIKMSESLSEVDAFSAQEELIAPVRKSADAREGATAFIEKRPPRWRGC